MRTHGVALVAVTLAAFVPSAGHDSAAGHGDRQASTAAPGAVMLSYRGAFAGVAADHESILWEGQVDELGGRSALALIQLGSPMEAANPVWVVRVRWTFEAEDTVHSFVADLGGSLSWKVSALRLSGAVVEGWMSGSQISSEARIADLDLAGTVLIVPSVSAR